MEEMKWSIEGYHKYSFHLLTERRFGTEKEAVEFGKKLKKGEEIVPILFENGEPVKEI